MERRPGRGSREPRNAAARQDRPGARRDDAAPDGAGPATTPQTPRGCAPSRTPHGCALSRTRKPSTAGAAGLNRPPGDLQVGSPVSSRFHGASHVGPTGRAHSVHHMYVRVAASGFGTHGDRRRVAVARSVAAAYRRSPIEAAPADAAPDARTRTAWWSSQACGRTRRPRCGASTCAAGAPSSGASSSGTSSSGTSSPRRHEHAERTGPRPRNADAARIGNALVALMVAGDGYAGRPARWSAVEHIRHANVGGDTEDDVRRW